ncbi:MAG: hypothetical protein NC033_05360 [Clostridiales bacterium]|nr:hypothetical protein [Clostridiales bacterium]
MISYDNYKNRIEKLAKAKRILHKFRFLICGVLALIVGTSVGLMVAKGSYTSGMSLSAQTIAFNEDYEVSAASAFLASPSEQRIEYRLEGGDWTSEKPVKAGKYSARTVTKKLVGYSYSPAVSFEILPLDAEFTVTGGSVTYGGVPDFTLPQLVAGHRVDKSSLQFTYAEYGAPSTEVNAVESSLKIIDASGDDFTCCYNVTFNGKTLSVNKKNITITPETYGFTYDGKAHNTDNAVAESTQNALVYGDTLTAVTAIENHAGGAVDADEYTVRVESFTLMHGNVDISGWYNVNTATSSLTVNRRPLAISTASDEKFYDGAPLEKPEFTYNNLVEGHTVTADLATLPKNAGVGTYENRFNVTVYDGTADITRNYRIDGENSAFGTLTINPAKLTVTTATPEAHTYDGTPFTDFNFTVAETLDEKFKVTAVESLSADTTDAGEHKNDFKVRVTLNGIPVTDNFEITYNYGKLTVKKRNITVTTGSDTKVYDGDPLVCDNPAYTNLAEGHSLKITKPFSVTNVTGGSGVKNAVEYTVRNEKGKDVGYNYVIEHTLGTLKIEPLQISVKTVDASREYDGTPFSDAGYTATRINAYGEGLCGTDMLTATSATSLTNAGSVPNVCAYTLPTYDGTHSNYVLVGGIACGTLEVRRKSVSVTVNDANSVYGENIPDNGFTLGCGALPNGETLSFTTHFERDGAVCTPANWSDENGRTYTLLNAGSYSIVGNGDAAISGGNASVENYDFTFTAGTLVIGQRNIIVTTATASHIYDGKPFYDTSYTTAYRDGEGLGLLNGDELTVNSYMTVRTIDDIPTQNAVTYSVPNGNYKIAGYIYGSLVIIPRPIIVYTASREKSYDGSPLSDISYTAKYAVEKDGEWVPDETKAGIVSREDLGGLPDVLIPTTEKSITDAGEIKNANRYTHGNYSVKKYVDGTLTVKKVTVNIGLAEYSTYYGYRVQMTESTHVRFVQNGYNVNGGDVLVNGERLTVTAKYMQDGKYVTLRNAGTYKTVAAVFEIFRKDGSLFESATAGSDGKCNATNYIITCGDGEEVVTPREVEVDIGNGTAVYGENVNNKTYSLGLTLTPYATELPYNEQLTLTYKYDRTVKDVGEYDIYEDKVFIDGKEIDIENCNYAFTFNSGTLTVTARAVTLRIDSFTNINDNNFITYGESLPENGYTVTSGTVIEGDEITLGYSYYKIEWVDYERVNAGRIEAPKYAGSYGITADAVNLNGTEIAFGSDGENYNITLLDGELYIQYATVAVDIKDISGVEYGDGWDYPEGQPDLYEGELFYGDTIDLAVKYVDGEGNEYINEKPAAAGRYTITVDGANTVFFDKDGAPIPTCYQFAFIASDPNSGTSEYLNDGVLEIAKKQVHIKLSDTSYRYGREDQLQGLVSDTGYSRTDGKDDPVTAYGEILKISVGYKKNGVELERVQYDWGLNVGDYTAYAVKYYIKANAADIHYIDSGTELKNYEIVCEDGNVEITTYDVRFKINDNTCVYGTPESGIENTYEYTDGWTVNQMGGKLPYGEKLVLSYSYNPSINGVGTYTINATATGVTGGNADLNNYNPHCSETGTLTVTALDIYVVLGDNNTCEYGGEIPEFTYKVYLDENGEGDGYTLKNGDKFAATFGYYVYGDESKAQVTPKNAGGYGITAFGAYIKTASGEPSGNYTVHVTDGKLTVTPKTVTVVLSDLDPVYYGETFSYPAGVNNFKNYETIGLEYEEKLEVAVAFFVNGEKGTPKNANDLPETAERYQYSASLNKNACKVFDKDGNEIESGAYNYTFVCDDLENLQIKRVMLSFLLIELGDVPYGDTVKYPDGPRNYVNYKLYNGGSSYVDEDAPYGEYFEVEAEYQRITGSHNIPVDRPVDIGEYREDVAGITVYGGDGKEMAGGELNYYVSGVLYGYAFEIVPREITVKLSDLEIEYGDDLDYPDGLNNYDLNNSDALVFNQKLWIGYLHGVKYQKVVGGDFVTPKDAGTYIITFDEENEDYMISDGDETYYDGSYDITFMPGTLTITQKRINVSVSTENSTYGDDELPVHSYMFTVGSGQTENLPYGDTFAADGYIYYLPDDGDKNEVTPRNAGTYGVTFKAAKINGESTLTESESGNYYITVTDGELNIRKADLTLALSAVQDANYGDYRGYPSGIGNFDTVNTEGIQHGDRLELSVLYEVLLDYRNSGLVNVGDVSADVPANAAIYRIILDDEHSVIHTAEGEQFGLGLNYNVDCESVNFRIWYRMVIIKYSIPEYTYGEEIAKPQYSITVRQNPYDQNPVSTTELPYGETCDFDFYFSDKENNRYDSPVNAGEYTVHIKNSYVYGSEARAKNYWFGTTEDSAATLTVSRKEIEITLDKKTYVYGDFGVLREDGGYDILPPDKLAFDDGESVLEYEDTLAVHVKYTKDGKGVTPKDAGTYSVEATGFTVSYSETEESETAAGDRLKNYKIICNGGELEIAPKELHIAISKDVEITYGDDLPELGDIPYTVNGVPHTDFVMPYGENLNVGIYYDGTPVNAGEYAIVYDGWGINLNPSDNYDVDGEDGLLTIKQRELTVKISGGAGVYGYETFPEIAHEVTEGGLLGDEELVPAYIFSQNGKPLTDKDGKPLLPVNAGTYDIAVDEERSAVTGGNALYSNYKVTYIYEGKLIIDRSPLSVKLLGDSFTYGERAVNVGNEIAVGALYHGDELELTYTFINKETGDKSENPAAAGVYSITAEADIVGGNASVDNYDITFVENDPTLTILKRGIEITLNKGGVTSFTYGKPFAGDICSAEIVGAADGEIITVAVIYTEKAPAQAARYALRARSFVSRAAEEAFIPKDAGTYIASLDFENCTVTDRDGNPVGGGIENYKLSSTCGDVEFTITPMDLTVSVTDAQITYGDALPDALAYSVAEDMPDGESLVLTFSFADEEGNLPVHAGTYPVTVAGKEISGGKISNYNINYEKENHSLKISEKPVKIRVSDLWFPFGTAVEYKVAANNYNLNSSDALAEGDELTVTEVKFTGKDGTEYTAANPPADAGEYEIVFVSFTAKNADGEDATGDYAVTKLNGTLNISTGLVILYTANAEKEYDGTALSTDKYERYDYDGGDVGQFGYRIIADGDSICERTDVTGEDGVNNTTKFKIVDADGNETGNLKLKYGPDNATYGKLKVTPRKIEIKSQSATKDGYDGTAVTADYEVIYKGATEGGKPIADRDTFTVTGTGEQIDAGESENTVYFTLTNKDNYEITTNFGRLKVSRKYVEVTIDSVSAVYGEQPVITHGTHVPLAAGETLSFGVEYFKGVEKVTPQTQNGRFILPVGKYQISYDEDTAYITGGRASVDNYDLNFAPAADFEVTARHIAVNTADASAEYSGVALTKHDGYTTCWVNDDGKQSAEGLLGGDTLEFVSGASQTEVGSTENKCEYKVPDNYVIDENFNSYGTLTVTERQVAVVPVFKGATPYIYDGEEVDLSLFGYTHSHNIEGAAEDDKYGFTAEDAAGFTATYTFADNVGNILQGAPVNAGTYVVSVTLSGAGVSSYTVKFNRLSFTIGKRPLQIATGDADEVYDGLPHGNTEYKSAEGLLTALNHRLVVDYKDEYVNATEGEDNNTTYSVMCGDDDLSDNYQIGYTAGTIVIAKKPVTVTLKGGLRLQYGDDYVKAVTDGAVTLENGETAEIAVICDRAVNGIGTYTARAVWADTVIKNAGGKIIENGFANYEPQFASETVEFEVIPREIKVTLNRGGVTQFAYGDDYDGAIRNATVKGMVSGERLVVAVSYQRQGESGFVTPEFVGNYTAKTDKENCTVTGGDIENYEITVCPDFDFAITARELTVSMDDITVGYGETPAYPAGASGYKSVVGLLSGDTLKVIPAFERDGESVEPVFAGTYDIVCGGIVVSGGAVGAENYTVKKVNKGTLTINGTGIEIVRKTVTKTYDGTPLELDPDAPADEVEYVINGDESLKLPAGYRLILDGSFATKDGNVSSSRNNTAIYKVVDASGNAAGEYEVSHRENGARLEIEQKVINVAYGGATRSYNGAALTAECIYSESDLVAGHKLTTSNHAEITDYGSITNSMTVTITADGAVVTPNYDINIISRGTLTVEKLSVTVALDDQSKVYGESLEPDKYYESELVNGEKLRFRALYKKGDEICDAAEYLGFGEYTVTGDESSMSVVGGKLTNYTVTFTPATLTVAKRQIIVKTADAMEEYSGNALSKYDGYDTEWIKDGVKQSKKGLLGTDTLVMLTFASRTEIGETENACTYSAPENYEIAGYENGTLKVTKIAITINTNAILNKVYCGTPYSDGGFTYTENKLLAGHGIAVAGEIPEFLDATEGEQNVFAIAITAGGEDVTETYYNVNYNYGKVVIAKKAINVTLNGAKTDFEYGDSSFDTEFKKVTADGLVGGDEITTVALLYEVRGGKAPVNAGTYTVRLDTNNCYIAYAGEGNGAGNYEITCASLEFEITRREITLSLGEWAAAEYDGKTHAYDGSKLAVTGGQFAYEEETGVVAVRYCSDAAGLITAGTPKDAGTYYVFLDTDATTVKGTSQVLSANYNVTCQYITHIITPKKLVIGLSDVTHTYDGEAYDFADGKALTTNLCDGDAIACKVIFDGDNVNAGSCNVEFDTANISFTSGKAANYELDAAASKLSCTLTIEKRGITIKVDDRVVERGGEEYTKAHISSGTSDDKDGFVGDDLDRATVTFSYTDILPLPANAVAYKSVTAEFGGDVMNNYDVKRITAGTLTVTERKVLVKPVLNDETPHVYDGNAVALSLFGYVHLHDVESPADGDEYGFSEADAASLTATYTFTDKEGNRIVGTPVNAGTYTVKVTLSGDALEGYYVRYDTIEFVISPRPLSYTVAVNGTNKFVYSNSRPDFEASLTECAGFAGDGAPEYTFELCNKDGKIVTRYNVGKYYVVIAFAGMENYEITAGNAAAVVEITERTIVVTPTDPYGGVAQEYRGENLTLGATNFEIASRNTENGDVAEGDEVTVVGTSLAPTQISGNLTISAVHITSGGEDVSANYKVIYTYNALNATIKSLGLLAANFRVRVSYTQTEIHYTLGELGKTLPYTGANQTYTFDGGAISLSEGETLGYGHKLSFGKNTVTVPAAAGEYADLITSLVKVYDGEGADVTAIYSLVCDNPESGIIYVRENVLSADLSALSASELTVGKLDIGVNGLFEDATPAHRAEVTAFYIDGGWLIGITVFSETAAGRRSDLSANYKLDENCTLDGATVKIITLSEAEEYARPAIGVEITVSASELAVGKDSGLFAFDGESRWVLNGGYVLTGGENLAEGHSVQVLVFVEDGKYVLGVSVASVQNGSRTDVSSNYRLKDIVTTDVKATYITAADEANMQREIYVDFSGCTIDEGVIEGYTVVGLSAYDKHKIQVTATQTDGGYVLTVALYRVSGSRKYNVGGKYSLIATLPDGVTAQVAEGSLN